MEQSWDKKVSVCQDWDFWTKLSNDTTGYTRNQHLSVLAQTEAMWARFRFACVSVSFKLSKNDRLNQAATNYNFGNCQHLLDVLVNSVGLYLPRRPEARPRRRWPRTVRRITILERNQSNSHVFELRAQSKGAGILRQLYAAVPVPSTIRSTSGLGDNFKTERKRRRKSTWTFSFVQAPRQGK